MACPTGKLVVKPLDPRITYNTVADEIVITCPYNASHAVQQSKFHRHVMGCYQQHLQEQQAKGQKSLFSICQFDGAHHIRSELLEYHEERCGSRVDFNKGGWTDNNEEQGPVASSSSAMAAANQSKIQLGKPREPSPDALAKINGEEDWDAEPGYGAKFDPNKAVEEVRASGRRNFIPMDHLVGKTKSQKQKIYEKAAKHDKSTKGFIKRGTSANTIIDINSTRTIDFGPCESEDVGGGRGLKLMTSVEQRKAKLREMNRKSQARSAPR